MVNWNYDYDDKTLRRTMVQKKVNGLRIINISLDNTDDFAGFAFRLLSNICNSESIDVVEVENISMLHSSEIALLKIIERSNSESKTFNLYSCFDKTQLLNNFTCLVGNQSELKRLEKIFNE